MILEGTNSVPVHILATADAEVYVVPVLINTKTTYGHVTTTINFGKARGPSY